MHCYLPRSDWSTFCSTSFSSFEISKTECERPKRLLETKEKSSNSRNKSPERHFEAPNVKTSPIAFESIPKSNASVLCSKSKPPRTNYRSASPNNSQKDSSIAFRRPISDRVYQKGRILLRENLLGLCSRDTSTKMAKSLRLRFPFLLRLHGTQWRRPFRQFRGCVHISRSDSTMLSRSTYKPKEIMNLEKRKDCLLDHSFQRKGRSR